MVFFLNLGVSQFDKNSIKLLKKKSLFLCGSCLASDLAYSVHMCLTSLLSVNKT